MGRRVTFLFLLMGAAWGGPFQSSASAQTFRTLAANLTSATCTAPVVTGCVQILAGGMGTGTVEVSGTYSGTITFEVSGSGGTWTAVNCTPPNTTTQTTTTTSTGNWGSCNIAGYAGFRARMSSYTSGVANVTLSAAATGGGGGGGGGGGSATASLTLQEPDDASIAAGSTADAVIGLTQVYDGSVWRRLTIGAAGTASAQVVTVQGIAAMTPLLTTTTLTAGDLDIGNVDLEFAGTAASTGNGASGAQTLRVTLANDGTGVVGLVAGDADIGNVDLEFAGTAASVGNGASGAQTLRVTLANDSTGVVGLVTGVNYIGYVGAIGFIGHDAPIGGNAPVIIGGYAAATAPANVSTTGDAVTSWFLPNGAQVMNLAAGGTLITATSTSLNVNCTAGCAGGTQYNEDVAAASADTTTLAGILQDSTPGNTAADGDYTVLQADSGLLWVRGRGLQTPNGDSVLDDTLDGVKVTNTTASTASAYLTVRLSDGSSFLSPSSDQTLDAALTTTGPLMIGRGSTTPPTAMSADGDATAIWLDLTGKVHLAPELVDDAAFTPGTSRGLPVGFQADETATDSVDEGDFGVPRMTLDRRVYTATADPCSGAKSVHVVNMNTAATVEIANAVASQFFYVCSVDLVAAGAQTVAIGEDDTDGCGSITAGLAGGATAATGWSFAANGGITLGNGMGTVAKTGTAARYLCIITGQAQQISGSITYVSAP